MLGIGIGAMLGFCGATGADGAAKPLVLAAPLLGGAGGRGATGVGIGLGGLAIGIEVGLPGAGGALGLLSGGMAGLLSGAFGPADATTTRRPDALRVGPVRWPIPAKDDVLPLLDVEHTGAAGFTILG